MLMRQAAFITALAAAGQAAFDACGEPTKGPVLGGIDIVDAWAKALKARNATVSNQVPRLPHMAEAPPLRGSAEHAFTTTDGFALHFATALAAQRHIARVGLVAALVQLVAGEPWFDHGVCPALGERHGTARVAELPP